MTSPINLEFQTKIAAWRARAANNELTAEEMKEAITYLRQGRVAAANASATATRKKAIAAIPSAADMLSDLEGM